MAESDIEPSSFVATARRLDESWKRGRKTITCDVRWDESDRDSLFALMEEAKRRIAGDETAAPAGKANHEGEN